MCKPYKNIIKRIYKKETTNMRLGRVNGKMMLGITRKKRKNNLDRKSNENF